MPEPDLIEMFARPLNQAGIRHLISGSVAAMLYGEPRVTHAIDLIVFLRGNEASRIAVLFPSPSFYVPPIEIILTEMDREKGGHFNLIHSDSGLKADFYLAGRDELHSWAFGRARQYEIGTCTVTVAPPEYVIVRKLQYYREGGSDKHLRDVRGILATSSGQLDRGAMNDWIARLGLESEWRLVSA